jgi:hypothetical protein
MMVFWMDGSVGEGNISDKSQEILVFDMLIILSSDVQFDIKHFVVLEEALDFV